MGVLAIAAGVALFLLRKPFSELHARKWGATVVTVTEAGLIISSVLFIAWGIVALTGLIPLVS